MTKKEMVILNISVKDKLHLFEKIADKAMELNIVKNRNNLIKDFYEKERNFETYLTTECAIPHVRSSNVFESCIFYIKLQKPIKWTEEEEEAKYIFAILAKENDADLHIEMLMNISKKVINSKMLSILKETNDVNEIVEIINK